jgi:hypothetical protein
MLQEAENINRTEYRINLTEREFHPIKYPAQKGHADMVYLLLEAETFDNKQFREVGDIHNAFLMAARYSRADVVSLLLEAKTFDEKQFF